ncbi:uncharacterized protein LOC119983055 isoform X2 [Tripterygium wilfordii]|uniref:uncharacterized protein LOC119983055 isoform X1 n=1 Tax=Tripterygium wilfordii TaxID=458696 RepID=UPI0018F7E7D1|nr:uncharacterized protein LOC119983055 isoform X1 [Tripterygium wilfordii]XP_038682640.1 uncharacterized protein LOC119983055 isoform X2 [Tripterygium wilfordii]
MDNQPLLSTTTVTATTTIIFQDGNNSTNNNSGGILLRFLLIISVGIISLWANYEASKGFDIAIINDAGDSPAGKRFKLFYTSNDKAVRILQDASTVVQTVLYTNNKIRPPPPQHVTLRLLPTDELKLNNTVTVEPIENNGLMFSINISPSMLSMEGRDDGAFIRTVQRGMARVWVLYLYSRAPSWAVDGMVEYVSMMGGFGSTVGEFLH